MTPLGVLTRLWDLEGGPEADESIRLPGPSSKALKQALRRQIARGRALGLQASRAVSAAARPRWTREASEAARKPLAAASCRH